MAHDYDIITVGGGAGGAALAKTLAEKGVRVLVVERETAFRDRVRGEYVHPWGVSELRALGLYDLLKQSCAFEARWRIFQMFGAPPAKARDLLATTPHQAGSLHFPHPQMQEALLGAAIQAGATVPRGATVAEVTPGAAPGVRVQSSQGEHTYKARLVIGADGRSAAYRKWGNFPVNRDPLRMVITGALFSGLSTPNQAVHVFVNPALGQSVFIIPIDEKRFRCYLCYYHQPGRRRLSGHKDAAEFLSACAACGAPGEWFVNAQPGGPLATFDCTETWAAHPYRAGVALIGDAATTSDPSFGCGLGLTLRDVRVLSGLLLSETDWEAAAHAYAAEHDRYSGAIHRLLGWLVQLYYEPGPAAAARRERALARIAEDPRRAPDIPGLGPEAPSDEAAYRNLFGDE